VYPTGHWILAKPPHIDGSEEGGVKRVRRRIRSEARSNTPGIMRKNLACI